MRILPQKPAATIKGKLLPDSGFHVYVSSKVLMLAGAVLTGILAMVLWLGSHVQTLSAGPAVLGLPSHRISEAIWRSRSNPGPWGTLDYTRIAIERPEAYVFVPVGDTKPAVWSFDGLDAKQVEQLFIKAGFNSNQIQGLLATTKMHPGKGLQVTPGADFIFNMTTRQRVAIYNMLGGSQHNPYYAMPLSWRADGIEEWLDDAEISDETVDLVKHLLYPRSNSMCFSDLATILTRVPSEKEQRNLIKALSRSNTMLIRLRVGPDSDIDALVRYWGKGGRAKDIAPLLESLKKVPGGATVDVAHLITPFARQHIYTYTYPPLRGHTRQENCLWSSMNFFRDTPDDRYTNLDEFKKGLADLYHPVKGAPTFGDILVFEHPGKGIIHAAVYIADGILFTKNGHDHNQPWLLMRLEDILARYPSEPAIKLTTHRPNGF